MSIPVALADLDDVLRLYGDGYVLTAGADATVRAVSVRASYDGATLEVRASRSTAANVAAGSVVTLLFPPVAPETYTLIVDGKGEVDGDRLRVTPTAAVLHRPPS